MTLTPASGRVHAITALIGRCVQKVTTPEVLAEATHAICLLPIHVTY